MGKKPIFLPSHVLKHFQLWIVLPFLNPFVLLLMSYITYIHTYHIHIVYIYIFTYPTNFLVGFIFLHACEKDSLNRQTPGCWSLCSIQIAGRIWVGQPGLSVATTDPFAHTVASEETSLKENPFLWDRSQCLGQVIWKLGVFDPMKGWVKVVMCFSIWGIRVEFQILIRTSVDHGQGYEFEYLQCMGYMQA